MLADTVKKDYSFRHLVNEEILKSTSDLKLYEIILVNNYGDRIENGWASLSIRDTSVKTLGASPPKFVEYQHQGNGSYTANIQPYRLKDKLLTLSVYAEHHSKYKADLDLLESNKRLELRRKKAPVEIADIFENRSYNDPCSRGADHYYNNGSYRLQITSKGAPAYLFWEVGCPATRGRGIMTLFDGETKSYLGETFGYHVTAGFGLAKDYGVRVEAQSGRKYFDIVFNTTSSEYIFRYDESKDLYSLEVR